MNWLLSLRNVEYHVAGDGELELAPGRYIARTIDSESYLKKNSAGRGVPTDSDGNFDGWPLLPGDEPIRFQLLERDTISYHVAAGGMLYIAELEEVDG